MRQRDAWYEGSLEDYIKFSNASVGIIYESIVTTGEGDDVNTAPMGIEICGDGSSIIIRPFKDTRTYALLSSFGHGVANFTDDVYAFYITTFGGKSDWSHLLAGSAYVKSPSLSNAYARLEFNASKIEDIDGDRAEVTCRVIRVFWRCREPRPYSRAEHAVLESLVHATRILHYARKGKLEDAERLMEILGMYRGLVGRTAPSSIYMEIIEGLMRRLGV